MAEQSSKAAQEIQGLMSDLDVNAPYFASYHKRNSGHHHEGHKCSGGNAKKTKMPRQGLLRSANPSVSGFHAEEQSASTQEMASATIQIARDATRMAELVEDMRTALEEIKDC